MPGRSGISAPLSTDAKNQNEQIDKTEVVGVRAKKLTTVAQANKEGLEAGGKEEAERRKSEKFDEINPPKHMSDEGVEDAQTDLRINQNVTGNTND